MKRTSAWILAALLATASLTGVAKAAEHTRVTNPNVLGGELLGRGGLYTLFFDRVLSDDLVAGVGYSTVGTKFPVTDADANQTATIFPVYLNFYFTREAGSLFATGGADIVSNHDKVNGLVSNSGNIKFNNNVVIPTFGLGYEVRQDAGFLFRVAAYGLVAKEVAPWIGFSFGYAF